MARRIGILGGTFDPIHFGHLFIAQESLYRLKMDKVIFVPARMPPHKPCEPISDSDRRYNMTVIATQDNPAFETSRIEMEREGPSYTVDTMDEFRRIYGDDAELFFITGADSILDIMSWHHPERLIHLCTLVATTRPGYDMNEARKMLPKEFLERIVFLEAPGVHVSSSELRRRVAEGMPIKYLVPDAVEDYIIKAGLYRK